MIVIQFARAGGLEPPAYGFGDRRSTSWAMPVNSVMSAEKREMDQNAKKIIGKNSLLF